MTNKHSFVCELPDSPFVTMMKSGFDIGLMLDEDLVAHFGAGGCAPVEGSVPLMDPFETVIYPDPNTIAARVVGDTLTISLDIEQELTKAAA